MSEEIINQTSVTSMKFKNVFFALLLTIGLASFVPKVVAGSYTNILIAGLNAGPEDVLLANTTNDYRAPILTTNFVPVYTYTNGIYGRTSIVSSNAVVTTNYVGLIDARNWTDFQLNDAVKFQNAPNAAATVLVNYDASSDFLIWRTNEVQFYITVAGNVGYSSAFSNITGSQTGWYRLGSVVNTNAQNGTNLLSQLILKPNHFGP